MMKLITPLLAGGIFGTGLLLSDMIDPARVLAFLNVTSGAWDPTLAFVMGGAMIPMFIAWMVRRSRQSPVFAETFPSEAQSAIDARLLRGAALFGLGWGLVGLCPGPALSGLLIGGWPVLMFVAAMLAGMFLQDIAFTPRKADAQLN